MKNIIVFLMLLFTSSAAFAADSTVSLDKSSEKSDTKSHQKKVGTSKDRSQSYSVDVNINGLLLREFTARYERSTQGEGKAWDYFNTCKPLMNLKTDYPVIDIAARNTRDSGRGIWAGHITGKNYSTSRNMYLPYFESSGESLINADPDGRYVPRYVQCRITASYWIAEAGNRSVYKQVHSEDEIRDRIRSTFEQMDKEELLFENFRQRARELWSQANCAPFLKDFKHTKSAEMECGVFNYVGTRIEVENRETLSEASIDGRSYKISVNTKESESVAVDESVSADRRVSSSEKKGMSKSK